MNAKEFRAELVKIMPGYDWTVHRPVSNVGLRATGKQTSGFNRLSTISVDRFEVAGSAKYRVRSAGHGLKARWLGEFCDTTLARALRGLQQHYQGESNTYRAAAAAMEKGRKKPEGGDA